MSKTLNTIQTLSKIARVLSKIIFIFCIVGACGCIVGAAGVAFGIGEVLKLGSVTINGIVADIPDIPVGAIYAALAFGFIAVAGEAVIAKLAEIYFRHELEAGTPFTFAGAKELLRLGILTIVIPCAVSVIGAIVYAVTSAVTGGGSEFDFNVSISLGLGIMFIIMSVVFKYGAELAEGKSEEL